jgi:cytochrome c oxidase subunit 2
MQPPGPGPPRIARFLPLAIWTLGAFALYLALSRRWIPPLASAHGAGIDGMLDYTLLTAGSLVILGHVILGYMVWRFNGREPARPASVSSAWSLAIAIAVALIAEGGVFALGLPVWKQYYGTDAPAGALVIEVTTEQFAWNVRYPGPDGIFGRTLPALITLDNPLGLDPADPHTTDDLVTLNVLHAIAGRPVRIRLRSKDVVHGFFLPNLRVKQDAVPGMTIDVWFTPTRPGRFELACTQLCGFGHYEMKGILIVESPAEFAEWQRELGNG